MIIKQLGTIIWIAFFHSTTGEASKNMTNVPEASHHLYGIVLTGQFFEMGSNCAGILYSNKTKPKETTP